MPQEVEDVVVGCGLPEGATGHNVARNAALEAGFGDAVPGMTINRYCGSGLSAASIVANRIATGEATIAIAARRREHQPRPVQPQPERLLLRAAPAAHARGVVDDEPDRRLRREEVRHHPRGAGRVRRAEPAARRRGGGRRQVRGGDRAVHDEDEGHRQGDGRDPRAGGDPRSRRGPAARHDARRPRRAQARLSRAARRRRATPRSSPTAPARSS